MEIYSIAGVVAFIEHFYYYSLLSVRLFTPECKQISALWYNMEVGTKWQLPEYTVSRATKLSSVHGNFGFFHTILLSL